jgi:hypothetical protein
VKNALEPEWEARLEPTSYDLRPGRSCQDAISAIFCDAEGPALGPARRPGQARDGIGTETATDIPFGPLVFRVMSGHAPLDEEHADAISAAALEGLLGPDM